MRELRLLAAHAPPYNRRSKFPKRWWWVVLTDEAFPRFSTVRAPKHDCAVGPFRSRADAAQTAALLARFTGVRTCSARLGRSALHGPRCPEHEVSPCPTPRDIGAADYAAAPQRARDLIEGADTQALVDVLAHITDLAGRARYETAARLRDHATTAIEVLWRGQRLRALAGVSEMVAARPDGAGGWRLAVIRNGQLAAAGKRRAACPRCRCRRRDMRWRTSGSAESGASRRRTRRRARADRAGSPSRACGSCARNPVRLTGRPAGRFADWAASARSARVAAEQLAETRSDSGEKALTEPHPTREQLFGGTGVDGLGGPGQTRLPAQAPTGVAG